MQVVFMGTPEFAVPHLKALHAAGYGISFVVTQPDRPAGRGRQLTAPPVKVCAQSLGLRVMQPERMNDPQFRERMIAASPDAICVVAYGALLPSWLLDLPRLGCINVHPSLLPAYRGAAPIQRALMAGDRETGVTTMYLSEVMDGGDMIFHERVAIGPDDNAGTMHDRLAEVGADLLLRTLSAVEDGCAPRIRQTESDVTFAPKIEKAEGEIDWTWPAMRLHHLIRGLTPWPGAYTYHGGRRVKLWRTQPEPDAPAAGAPGLVVAASEAITIQTGEGHLHLLEVQPPNGKRATGREYVNGYRLQVGDRLRSKRHDLP